MTSRSDRIAKALASLAMLPALAWASDDPAAKAAKIVRGYCLADVCLGMTIRELEKVEGGTLVLYKQPPPERNCNGRPEETISGKFTARDGQVFQVWFRDHPGRESSHDRYRLSSAEVTLNLSTYQFNHVRIGLTTRFGFASSDIWKTGTSSQWSNTLPSGIVLGLLALGVPSPNRLNLFWFHPSYAAWMGSQAECQKAIPRL